MMTINDYNYQEFHFLSTCYEEGISDLKVYTLFVQKILTEMDIPSSISVNAMQKHILDKYLIEIPPTFIKEIIKNLSSNNELKIKNETIVLTKIPDNIQRQVDLQRENTDRDVNLIFTEFNNQLQAVGQKKINIDEFNIAFKTYCNLILKKEFEHSDISKKMSDWIYNIYRDNNKNYLIAALNKMIYSWLLEAVSKPLKG
jgi:hypothetical protein